MKLVFFWTKNGNEFHFQCTCTALDGQDFNPLTCLLTDDGGMGISDSIQSFFDANHLVRDVQQGNLVTGTWDRERWGVTFTAHTAKVYSLLDEDYHQTLALEGFKNVLETCVEFLQQEPSSTRIVELVI